MSSGHRTTSWNGRPQTYFYYRHSGLSTPDYSSRGGRRDCLRADRFLFSVSRRSFDARLGFVFFRTTGGFATESIICRSFSRQSSTFRDWSRYRWLDITNSPPLVIRRRYFVLKRPLTSSGKLGEAAIPHRNCAFVATLFTFWPPGPELRTNVQENSSLGMQISAVTTRAFVGPEGLSDIGMTRENHGRWTVTVNLNTMNRATVEG